ncbi:hypothetical protein LINPERPRIM_LOCUS8486, partial [Linum perenne]
MQRHLSKIRNQLLVILQEIASYVSCIWYQRLIKPVEPEMHKDYKMLIWSFFKWVKIKPVEPEMHKDYKITSQA